MSKPTGWKTIRRARRRGQRQAFSAEPAVVFDRVVVPLGVREVGSRRWVNLAMRALRGER